MEASEAGASGAVVPATKRPAYQEWRVLFAIVAVTVIAMIAALMGTRGMDPLRADSASYIVFDPSRTVGYPAFIGLVRLLTANLALVVPAQILLLAASLITLGRSFYDYTRRPLLTVAFQIVLISGVELWKLSMVLLTEALAGALVAFWCAQLLQVLRAPKMSRIAVLVALAALATMVRPAFVALFVATGVAAIVVCPQLPRGRALGLIVAGFLMSWGATPVGQYLAHGSFETTSPFARGVLQHTLFCEQPRTITDPDSQFVERSAAPARRYVADAPPEFRSSLERTYSGQLRFGWIIPSLVRAHGMTAGWQSDPIMARIAGERVRANPSCYAGSVLAADLRMLTYGSSAKAAGLREYLSEHPPAVVPAAPMPPADARDALRAAHLFHAEPAFEVPPPFKSEDRNPAFLMLLARILFTTAAVIGALALIALPFRAKLHPKVAHAVPVAAVAGAAFHGTLVVTSIVELGLSRYCAPLWPLMAVLTYVLFIGGRSREFSEA